VCAGSRAVFGRFRPSLARENPIASKACERHRYLLGKKRRKRSKTVENGMTTLASAGSGRDSRRIIRRYYLAMSVPFGIDVLTSAVYAAINAHPLTLLPLSAVSAVFLLLGVGAGAWLLIRPVERFLAASFRSPRSSAR
jgi:hypothetical protein